MYETIFSPIELGELTLKNRVIFAPTSLSSSAAELEKKLCALAAGGCAMIILGDVPVGSHGPRSLHSKKGFAFYQSLCKSIHAWDCKVCAQLHQSDSDLAAMLKYIPGVLLGRISAEQLRGLLNQQVGPYISNLPERRVQGITAAFGTAAALAQQAGFDMVQVHGDRMCGSFSSAVFNSRSDRYGGSPERRAQFAVEAVTAVRQAVPDMPIDYKLAVRQETPHYGNAGVLLEELPVFVPLLERAGVTSFHVTLANHAALSDTIPPANHPAFGAEGCFLPFLDRVRGLTKLPLCGVGGLSSPEFVEAQLASGRVDCVAMSRQLIADADWPRKVQAGQPETIRHCIRCNKECLGGIQGHRGVGCIFDR